MKTLSERLKYAMEVLPPKKIKGVELARAVGVKPPSVSDWLSGKSKTMEGENLIKASKFLGVSASWLASGMGKPVNEKIVSEDSLNNTSPVTARMAPVLSWVQAGTFTNVQALDLSHVEEWLPLPEECTNCFYLKVVGISNSPDFLEGDYILVDPDVYYGDMQSGDMIVVRKFDDATFKKLVIESDNSRYLQALNPNFHPNIIPLDEHCHFVGQVVDCMRYTYRAKRRSRPS
ncbi:MAG: XRE family transcriptional regulator [Acinetobacter sp.]|jgi:SOS-response transcriptional repressor LexA|uniref:LexA family protein n=1 Tax=Acinetobacter sp. TaxID=472 RepID=UPI002839C513|nr:XRE family transcriptional regulator [Acinetobacter sp.]MDR2060932.1 XRE family transcriptional regulator [Acinetobacter sp.]